MSDKYSVARCETVDCVNSLQKAIQDAGGQLISTERMEQLTLMQFITTIASQNLIRFYFDDPEEE